MTPQNRRGSGENYLPHCPGQWNAGGYLRILTDGYFFGTITELLVLPEYQRQGIGSALLALAKQHTPTLLYFGAQLEAERFYERNGCRKSLQSHQIDQPETR